MRDVQVSFLIVIGYLLVGGLFMLGSGKVAGLLKRLGKKPVAYTRIGLFTFGACVAAIGAFGLSLFVLAFFRQA